MTAWSSSSGSKASLLGAGVNEELDPAVAPAAFGRPFDGAGVVSTDLAGNAAGEPAEEGVFWKKPRRVLWPPEEEDFFRAGVAAGVEAFFLGGILVLIRPETSTAS